MSGYTLSILLCMAAGLAVLAVGLIGLPPAGDSDGATTRNLRSASAVEVAGAEAEPRRGSETDVVRAGVELPAPRPADGGRSAPPGGQPAPELTPSSTPTPAPTPRTDERVRVVGTDGEGVVLHSAPQASARLPAGFLEGWELTVLERSGDEWARARGPNGREGWVRARYLAPQP
jgi:hypothetical protein